MYMSITKHWKVKTILGDEFMFDYNNKKNTFVVFRHFVISYIGVLQAVF